MPNETTNTTQSRRREIATLLALGIVRAKKRIEQRTKSPGSTKALDLDTTLWTDTTDTTA